MRFWCPHCDKPEQAVETSIVIPDAVCPTCGSAYQVEEVGEATFLAREDRTPTPTRLPRPRELALRSAVGDYGSFDETPLTQTLGESPDEEEWFMDEPLDPDDERVRATFSSRERFAALWQLQLEPTINGPVLRAVQIVASVVLLVTTSVFIHNNHQQIGQQISSFFPTSTEQTEQNPPERYAERSDVAPMRSPTPRVTEEQPQQPRNTASCQAREQAYLVAAVGDALTQQEQQQIAKEACRAQARTADP